MSPYLPSFHNLAGAAGLAVAVVLFSVLGAAVIERRSMPAVQLLAGWGIACIVLTLWAIVTPLSLRLPLALMSIAGLSILAVPRLRRRIGAMGGVWRLLVLTIPLWIVALPIRPSQVDTWLNLLPNAAYLFDHGMVPAAARPPSYSFLPGAPYNTQFVAFIASVASGSFAEGAMILFNVLLQCAAGLLLAHVVSGEREVGHGGVPPWWACAAGFLLAIPLNPGFAPRVFLAPYGEAPLAVATLFALWLAARTLGELARGLARPPAAVALALVLTALVNTKQSGPGLVAPLGIAMLVFVLVHPRIPALRGAVVTLAAIAPAAGLFLAWHAYAAANLPGGELQLIPWREWNWHLGPILVAMLHSMFRKATYFLFMAVALGAAIRQLWRNPWDEAGILLGLFLGLTLLFNAFLVFTYVAHFGEEHSYFRYMSQLSLALMLALVVALRPLALAWLLRRRGAATRARLAGAAIALVLILPFVFIGVLRVDLATPLSEFWSLGHRIARFLKPCDKVALLLPGDNGSVDSMLRGVLLFTPPRRPALDFRTETTANLATLEAVGRDGYRLAFVSCTPPGMTGVPPHVAAMLARGESGWRPVAIWPYPPGLAKHHFTS
ncbi:MAG: hypothetical protein ACREFQ_05080, partial [Stellaceae bacterium]